MNLFKIYSGLVLAVVLLGSGIDAHADEQISYQPNIQASWQHLAKKDVCSLVLSLADYGEARFIADASMLPAFELQAFKDLHAPGPVNVAKYAPPWHPDAPLREELGVLSHIEGGGAVARGKLASTMLFALREGMHVELTAPAWFDPRSEVLLDLPAKDLNPALGAFMRCAQTDIKVSWQEMSRTRIGYKVDQHELDDAGRARLRSLASYVMEQPDPVSIFVDGHTDASGVKQNNLRLAKHRAEAVAQYLRTCGLTSEQIVVRYHGAAYPVADNGTTAGKAKNRRTTVRLSRADTEAVAQN